MTEFVIIPPPRLSNTSAGSKICLATRLIHAWRVRVLMGCVRRPLFFCKLVEGLERSQLLIRGHSSCLLTSYNRPKRKWPTCPGHHVHQLASISPRRSIMRALSRSASVTANARWDFPVALQPIRRSGDALLHDFN